MIGVNTSIFKSAGRKLVNLLGALKDRATYYENGTDSVAEKNRIDDLGVLDKATILLAPTATSDALVHSVKTYTGDDFLTSTWTGATGGWSVITNGVSCSGTNGTIRQNIEMTDYLGHRFRLTYTLSNVTDSTTISAKFGGGSNVALTSTNGPHTVYLTNDATVDNFQFTSGGNWAGDVTNISLVNVSSDFDFDRASSATRINSSGLVQDMQSITDPELVTNGDFSTSDLSSFGSIYATTSIENERLKVVPHAGQGYAFAKVTWNSQVGDVFLVKATAYKGNATNTVIKAHSGITIDNITKTDDEWTYEAYGVATSTQSIIRLQVTGADGVYGYFDNISVKDITFSTDVDLARINYDSNGQNGHILLEPTSTNLVTYSEDFSEWNKGVSTTVTPNFAISPDGTQNATRFQTPTGSGTYLTLAASMTIGNDYTLTLFLKNNGGENIDIGVAASSTVGTKTASVEVNLTNEWVRYELNFTADSNSNFVFIDNISNANSVDCLIWGAQLEALGYATSYIPNHGTAVGVTRAVETLVDSGNTTLINTDQGVFYAEIARTSNNANHELISLLQDSSTNTKIAIGFYANNNNFFIRTYYNGSDVYPIYDDIAPNLNQFYKVAIKYNRSGINNVWIDGVKVVADVTKSVSAPSDPITHLKFDWNPANTEFPFHGKCKALAVFNEALSDTELQNLTS